MLESGLVRTKSVGVICLKNVLIYSIACFCFYLLGYNLMFLDVGNWIGSFTPLANMKSAEFALLSNNTSSHLVQVLKEDYSSMALIFFQTTFVATAASVISGTVAERIRLWPFFIFVSGFSNRYLPHPRSLVLGRRLVGPDGLFRLCWLHGCSFCGWLGRTDWSRFPRTQKGQI